MSDRDAWCTPRLITKRLPIVDLDPCSNGRSTVRARRSITLDCKTGKRRGFEWGNGLRISWENQSVFCNPPWSNPKPWASKAWEAKMFCFLVIDDSSTEWWGILTQFPTYRFSFAKRVGFVPPPSVEESTNDRPCTLVCTPDYRRLIGNAFAGLGRWWKSE